MQHSGARLHFTGRHWQ